MAVVGLPPVEPPVDLGLPAQLEPGLGDPERRRSPQRRRRREGFAENETNWQQQSVGTGEGS